MSTANAASGRVTARDVPMPKMTRCLTADAQHHPSARAAGAWRALS
jgi:hypothetical protein